MLPPRSWVASPFLRGPVLVVAALTLFAWLGAERPPSGLVSENGVSDGFTLNQERGEYVIDCDQVQFPLTPLSILKLEWDVDSFSMTSLYPNNRACNLHNKCVVRCGPSYDFAVQLIHFLNDVPILSIISVVLSYGLKTNVNIDAPADVWQAPSIWCDGDWQHTRTFLGLPAEKSMCVDYRPWGAVPDDLTMPAWYCLGFCRMNKPGGVAYPPE